MFTVKAYRGNMLFLCFADPPPGHVPILIQGISVWTSDRHYSCVIKNPTTVDCCQ